MGMPLQVVVTGSECVGKTTLATQLAAHYGVLSVPEFARDYAAGKGAPLDHADREPIALGQIALEDEYLARARAAGHALLVHDTDLVSTVAYCHHYFGSCPPVIENAAHRRRPARYLLLDIDVPWVADGIRDRSDRREDVQSLFVATLARLEAPVTLIRGDWNARFAEAVRTIDALLSR
jgi:nicotinamide riboside kinase